MNTYREADNNRKNEVIDFLTQSVQQLRKQGNDAEADGLEKLCRNVKDNLFSIVVVGEFSAGKSTFLNAMMHKKILPSFSGETTATVNFLRDISCAPNGEAGVVYYREPEGKTEVLPDLRPETIEKVVSVRGNQGDKTVASTIDHVDLFLDSAFLKDGVMLVDSPGLNGLAEHHKEITEEQIRKSHASIFLFSADHPGSRSEFDFLRELKTQNNNVFFVLNKIDRIKESEGETPESVVATLNENYRSQFPEDRELPHIWPLSAGMALEARDPEMTGQEQLSEEQCSELEQSSRIGAFEDRLWKYLTQGERRHAQLCTPVETTLKMLKAETTRLEEEVRLLDKQTGTEELLQKQTEIQAAVDALQKERERTSRDLRKKISKSRCNLQESAEAKCTRLNEQVNRKLEQQETLTELRDYSDRLGSMLQSSYQKISEQLDEELKQELVRLINEEYQEYSVALDERLGESESTASIRIDPKEFNVSDFSTGIDLEKFEKESEKLKARIAVLEQQRNEAEEASVTERKKERELKACQERLNSLQESREHYELNFVVPEVTTREVQYYDREGRGGLFGAVAYLLVGKKIVSKSETKTDTTAHDMAAEEKNKTLNALDQKIEEEKKNVTAAKKTLQEDSELLTKRAERFEQEREEEIRKYNAMQQDMEEKLSEAQHRKMRRLRMEIADNMENTSEEILREIRKFLWEQEKAYVQMIQDIVTVNINDVLEKKQKDLLAVQQAIKGEARERDEKRTAAQENLKATQELIKKGVDISAELEDSLNDHIEQEDAK